MSNALKLDGQDNAPVHLQQSQEWMCMAAAGVSSFEASKSPLVKLSHLQHHTITRGFKAVGLRVLHI